jgi:hypothetical protein
MIADFNRKYKNNGAATNAGIGMALFLEQATVSLAL